MKGPYFRHQKPSDCGCCYPDVTRIGDDPARGVRILHCIVHGRMEIPLAGVRNPRVDELPIPTEEWRKQERLRLLEGEPGMSFSFKRLLCRLP